MFKIMSTCMRTVTLLTLAVFLSFGFHLSPATPQAFAAEPVSDTLDGAPVIASLDVDALETGKHYFYVRAGHYATGQSIHVPVIVIKGAEKGKRLLLTAAMHGDELNGIAVIHRLVESLEADMLKGALVAIPGVNQTGIIGNNRHFMLSGGGGAMADLNRIMPGRQNEGNAAERYAGTLWQNVLKENADLAVDLHTQTRGTTYPLFVFADHRNKTAWQMATDLMPDVLKRDKGQKGTLETTFIKQGIPAVTLEVGAPKIFQKDLIDRALTGLRNIMIRHDMIEGVPTLPASDPIIGSRYTNVQASTGGVATIHVGLLQPVKKGDHIATVRDPFGRVRNTYFAPHDGHVLALATDPVREAGTMLVRILR